MNKKLKPKFDIGDIVICPKYLGNRQGRILKVFNTFHKDNREGLNFEYLVLFVNGIEDTYFELWLEKVEL